MSKSVNKVILVGNLGKDPDIKYTPSGVPVAKITVATNERYKGKNGEWQERAEWHNVVLWQRLAEITGEYLTKGSKVYIEGRLQTRSWDDKQTNQKKYVTEVVANDLVLLSSRAKWRSSGLQRWITGLGKAELRSACAGSRARGHSILSGSIVAQYLAGESAPGGVPRPWS